MSNERTERLTAAFIAKHPGASRNDVAKGVHLNRGSVGEALEALRKQGKVRMEGTTRSSVYFPITLEDLVLKAVRYHAGATRQFISERTGAKPEHVGYFLAKLKDQGKVKCVGEKRAARYFHPQFHSAAVKAALAEQA